MEHSTSEVARALRAMARDLLRGLAAAAVLTGAAAADGDRGGGSSAPVEDGPSDLVWCHDEEHAIVRQQARWRCEHTIVGEEEAERIKQERVRRIQRVLRREREPVVPGKRLRSTGTGFFISDAGHLLTNAHVVRECDALTVTPAGGEDQVARMLEADPRRDLALLATGHASPDPAVFRDFDEVIGGETVSLVGYPLHGRVVIKPVMVTGTVDPDARPPHPAIFAISIDVRRGNSGGPILDASGRVIGVVFAKADTPAIYEKTGRIVRDLGIGMRLPVVREFLRATPVAMTTSSDDTRLQGSALMARARQFIAQVRCWR